MPGTKLYKVIILFEDGALTDCRWRRCRPHIQGARGACRNAVGVDIGVRAFGDRTPTHGYAATREAAIAAFDKSWRRE
jgi:hypothetical protein